MNSFLVKVAFTNAFRTIRPAALKAEDQVLRERSIVAPGRPADDELRAKKKKRALQLPARLQNFFPFNP